MSPNFPCTGFITLQFFNQPVAYVRNVLMLGSSRVMIGAVFLNVRDLSYI